MFIAFAAATTTTSYLPARPPPIIPKLILLDRDGVINEDVGAPGVTSSSQLRLTNNAASAIGNLRRKSCKVALITNQSCVGKGLITKHDLDEIHETLQLMLKNDDNDAIFDGIYQCLSTKEDKDPRMKPKPGMILDAIKDFDIKNNEEDSIVFIGDNLTDMQAASAAGVKLKILVSTGYGMEFMGGCIASKEPSLISSNLFDDNYSDIMDSVTPFVYAKNLYAASTWLCGEHNV